MPRAQRLTELTRKRDEIRKRIRLGREANEARAQSILAPLRWLDLGMRLQRLVRHEVDGWIAGTME